MSHEKQQRAILARNSLASGPTISIKGLAGMALHVLRDELFRNSVAVRRNRKRNYVLVEKTWNLDTHHFGNSTVKILGRFRKEKPNARPKWTDESKLEGRDNLRASIAVRFRRMEEGLLSCVETRQGYMPSLRANEEARKGHRICAASYSAVLGGGVASRTFKSSLALLALSSLCSFAGEHCP